MSVDFSQDRRDLHTLHALSNGTGSNLPESSNRASREQSTPNPVWKKKATPIMKPSDRRPSQPQQKKSQAGGNPYANMSNNLSTVRGNPSTLTLVPAHPHHPTTSTRSDRPPALKKTRLNVKGGLDSRPPDPGRPLPSVFAKASQEVDRIFGAKKSKQDAFSQRNTPPVVNSSEVIDVDEDIGEPIFAASESSDDLQLRQGERPGEVPISSRVQAILDVQPPSAQHPFNRVGEQPNSYPPPDPGPQTSVLNSKHKAVHDSTNVDESDPIEDADDFTVQHRSPNPVRRKRKATPSGYTEFEVGHVSNVVKQFSNKPEASTNPPEVDLRAKTRKGPKGGKGVIGSMKPNKMKHSQKVEELCSGSKPAKAHLLGKPPAATRGRKQTDAIATSSTNFQGGDRHDESEAELLLPIEQWAHGAEIIDSISDGPTRHWLCIQGNRVSILKHPVDTPKRTSVLEFSLDRDVDGVQLPRIEPPGYDYENPCLGFLQKSSVSDVDDQVSRTIYVKFLKEHASWIPRVYAGMVKALSSNKWSMSHIDASARRALWEGVKASGAASPISTEPQATRRKPKPRPAYAGTRKFDSSEGLPITSMSSYAPSLRRSSRNSSIASRIPARPPSPSADETILLYPSTGTGAVNVTRGDLKRLEPGEYLNDTLIELGLKLWLNDLKCKSPDLAEQVHVFSSFFYTQLDHKNVDEGYQSVRKWTSKFDLFKKKYIIVPINEHLHWYLAIICYPDRALNQPALTQPITPNVTTRNKLRESLSKPEPPLQGHASLPPPVKLKPDSTSSRSGAVDEQEVEEIISTPRHTPTRETRTPPLSPLSTLAPDTPKGDIVAETESEGEGDGSTPADVSMKAESPSLRTSPSSREFDAISTSAFYASTDVRMRSPSAEREMKPEEEVDELGGGSDMEVDGPLPVVDPTRPDQPYIFSFDSLGARHPHALKLLSRYLDLEAKDKKHLSQTTQAITKQASVPTQPNYCDCGVYLLHFVEQFMSDPESFSLRIADHAKPKKSGDINRQERELMWNHGAVAGKRDSLKQMLVSLSSAWKQSKETEGKGKGKTTEKAEDDSSETRAKSIVVDDDSDIEVLEMTPEPSKAGKGTRSRTPTLHRAQRLR